MLPRISLRQAGNSHLDPRPGPKVTETIEPFGELSGLSNFGGSWNVATRIHIRNA
jgi:hypothetical protein